MKLLISLGLILVTVVILAACGSYDGTTSPTKPPTTTTTAAATIGQLALEGQQLYSLVCAGCHGNSHLGATGFIVLSSYDNAQKLLDKIATMQSGYNQEQQWEVLCYLLLQHGWASEGTIFNPDTLSEILLPRD